MKTLLAINFYFIDEMSITQLKHLVNRRCPSTVGSDRVLGGGSSDIISLPSPADSLYRQLLAIHLFLASDTAE